MTVDVLAGIVGSLVVVIGAGIVAIARMHARLARIEEWIRIRERRNGDPPG